MKEFLLELRLFIAEKLLSWAFNIAPSSRKDGRSIKVKVIEYFDEAANGTIHDSLNKILDLVKNHGVSHHDSEILLWIVKNSQHQVWSILRSEEEAKEILAHHQKDHPDEYFYIESEEV